MFHWCGLSLLLAGIIWSLLRRVARRIVKNDDHVVYVDEFAGNLFSGVFVMEIGIVASEYGFYTIPTFTAVYFMLLIRALYLKYELGVFIDHYYNNGRKFSIPLSQVAIHIVIQISAMVAGQYLARFFWSFDAFDSHSHTHALGLACRTSISVHHPIWWVAFAEFLGPLTMGIVGSFVVAKYAPYIVTSVGLVNAFFFAHVSGSFYNQPMATAFTFHCKGYSSDLAFFLIYWVAPTLGQIVAWELLTNGKKLFIKRDDTVAEKAREAAEKVAEKVEKAMKFE